ncbi:hypothetical protein TrCOL_g12661 [Triparma columacea]|uniref:Uncharacterized protein n=1 Tax=Triparma columacea TaxID=722753 RepID=A0A9W7GGG2_9STRA|nr:hypothetical protein TrCOL_g12661 [Triparma columacea]
MSLGSQLREIRGGSSPPPSTRTISSFISCLTFTSVLLNSIRRLLPHALHPFTLTSFPAFLPYAYAGSVLWFLYYESYKGFHQKFIPVFVTRSGYLKGKPAIYKLPPVNVLYSGGWLEASRKRKILSYGVSLFVVLAIAISKRLPTIWRGCLDAGVVAGLGGAVVSLWVWWGKMGKGEKWEGDIGLKK